MTETLRVLRNPKCVVKGHSFKILEHWSHEGKPIQMCEDCGKRQCLDGDRWITF